MSYTLKFSFQSFHSPFKLWEKSTMSSAMSSQSVVERGSTSWMKYLILMKWHTSPWLGYGGHFGSGSSCIQFASNQVAWDDVYDMCALQQDVVVEQKWRWVVQGANSSKYLSICDLCVCDKWYRGPAYIMKLQSFWTQITNSAFLCICDLWFVSLCNFGNAPVVLCMTVTLAALVFSTQVLH